MSRLKELLTLLDEKDAVFADIEAAIQKAFDTGQDADQLLADFERHIEEYEALIAAATGELEAVKKSVAFAEKQ